MCSEGVLKSRLLDCIHKVCAADDAVPEVFAFGGSREEVGEAGGFQFFQVGDFAVDVVAETAAGAGEAGDDAGEFDVYEFIAEWFCLLHPEVFAQKFGCGQINDDSGDNFFADGLQCG